MPEGNTAFRVALFALLGVAGAGALAFGRDKLRNCFLLFVVTLGLGYRSLHVTPALRVIPAEIVLGALPLLLGSGGRPRRPAGNLWLPWWLLLLTPFWLLAWFPAREAGFPWDVKFAEFRNFALLVPLFLVAPRVLSSPDGWRLAVRTLVGVSLWLAVMGLVEYVFPGVAKLLPGFVGDPGPIAAGGFQRASFSFYGNPIAVFICATALPFSALGRDRPGA